MYHFFVEPSQIDVINKKATVTGSDFNHIKNVLRMKPGEELSLSNGVDNREYRCAVLAYGDDCVDCELRFIKEDNVELTSKIYLFQGLPKSDKMETVIQKAVELGVYEIIPVAMSRSIVKLDAKKAASRLARWQQISEAAAKQSKRGIVPKVCEVMTFKQAIEYANNLSVKLIPYEMADSMSFSCLEAIAIGLPIICTDNTGAADYIKNYQTGIVIESGSSESLHN